MIHVLRICTPYTTLQKQLMMLIMHDSTLDILTRIRKVLRVLLEHIFKLYAI